jgi:hypothetical protein
MQRAAPGTIASLTHALQQVDEGRAGGSRTSRSGGAVPSGQTTLPTAGGKRILTSGISESEKQDVQQLRADGSRSEQAPHEAAGSLQIASSRVAELGKTTTYIHAWIYTYIHTYMKLRVRCKWRRVGLLSWVRPLHTYTHGYIHTPSFAEIHLVYIYINTYTFTHTHTHTSCAHHGTT